ncbi:type I methionyl aminopeptidase [Spiroplasma platyhelix]|uniref:Methionine aminopeptidase n=1 Tax=Spiroplasma platyhelix PALS-1 TaxID=1276218 RepID=A0A846TX83_9MOLU|nr:type I methionyl aminopeptidase [Spiroplasma platyhelix]MBE4704299.1 Methionine aminopeptidase 1 [Spiroplasma platyhelix PALS-1]NKE38671.1 type I methionyl aminopeptidase [Spiroplasma platyhelix PALS-1]UJB28883.1 methionine aminopeptidase [Spiroplasma platyhelix PALS-1]
MVSIKSASEIVKMRKAGKIVAEIHQELAKLIKVGTTGKMLDLKAREIIKKHKATPSFLNYHGFPAVICVSVNEQLIHGIPNDRPFKLNDLVKVDAGAAFEGYHSDAAFSMCVGKPTAEQEKIINVTKEALEKAIEIIKPGIRIGDIGATIQAYVESQGFYLPTSYTGHGIGKSLHEDPAIPNVGVANTGMRLHAGMTICIEPMVQTTTDKVRVLKDQWTVVATDNKPTAHFEHTLLVTNDGCEILTK